MTYDIYLLENNTLLISLPCVFSGISTEKGIHSTVPGESIEYQSEGPDV